MALYVCENINEDLFVIINKLFSTRVHSILDIGVICFQFWTGTDLKIAPLERVLKNLLDTGLWD